MNILKYVNVLTSCSSKYRFEGFGILTTDDQILFEGQSYSWDKIG